MIFQIRLFQIRFFQISIFQIRLFQISIFQIRLFQIRLFQIKLFQIRLFQIKLFQIRLFQIRLFQIRLFPILFLMLTLLPLALIITSYYIKNPHYKTSKGIARSYSRVGHSHFQTNANDHLVTKAGLLVDQYYQAFDFKAHSKLPLIYLKIDYFAILLPKF